MPSILGRDAVTPDLKISFYKKEIKYDVCQTGGLHYNSHKKL
jgi:hypothetical protein